MSNLNWALIITGIVAIILLLTLMVSTITCDYCVGSWESIDRYDDNFSYIVFYPDGTGYIKSTNTVSFTWTRRPNVGLMDNVYTIYYFGVNDSVDVIIYADSIHNLYLSNDNAYRRVGHC